MAKSIAEDAVTADDARMALSLIQLGRPGVQSAAVLLARDDPMRIVWANPAATRLFGSTDADRLTALLFREQRKGPQLDAGLRRLGSYTLPRPEQLQLTSGLQTRLVTAEVSRTTLADGTALYGIAVQGSAPEADDGWPRSALGGNAPEPIGTGLAPHATAVAVPSFDHERAEAASQRADPPSAVPARRSARVTWQTDENGRVMAVAGHAGPLADLIDDALIGRNLSEALVDRGGDPDGRFAAAMAARETFGGLALAWPLRGGQTVAVHAGGVPLLGADGRFHGFRGFANVDLRHGSAVPEPSRRRGDPQAEGARPEPAGPVAAGGSPMAPDVRPGSPGPTAVESAATEPGRSGPAVEAAALPNDAVPPPPSKSPVQAFAKVVPLHPHRLLPPTPAVSGAPDSAALPTKALVGDGLAGNLSVLERSAFQEIAWALGVRRERETPAVETPKVQSPATTVPAAEVAPAPARESPAFASAGVSPDDAFVLQMLPVAVLVGRDGVVVSCNRAFLDLTGYRSAQQINQQGGLGHLLGGQSLDGVRQHAPDRPFDIVDGGGQTLPVEGRVAPISIEGVSLQVITIAQVFRDRDAAAVLDEAERQDFDAFFEALADAAALVDDGGRVLAFNRAGELLFGRGRAEISGQVFTDLATPDHRAAAATLLDHLRGAAARDEASLDLLGQAANGRTLPLRMAVRRTGSGRFGVIWRGPSGHAKLEQDLLDSNRQLEHAQAVKSDFLAKLSYEVRSPLNAIQGFAEIILDERFGPLGNERYREYLRDIRQAGASVLDLVSGLLDLARMEGGQAAMSIVSLDANRIIGEIVNAMQPLAHRGRVIMRMSLLPGLPAAIVDERAFRQMVSNVLSNAVKFNEPGGQVIVSTALGEAGSVAVRVRDTGIGMSEDEVAAAMEPFRPGATTTSGPRDGNGLGLPLARAMAEANQAALSIRSRKHEGTLVEIMLRAQAGNPLQIPAE